MGLCFPGKTLCPSVGKVPFSAFWGYFNKWVLTILKNYLTHDNST